MGNELVPYESIEKMGKAIAASKLFGMQTSEQAIALMLIAQAEGRHPAIAARDYHIIQGRPSLKADAMLARFQEAGGKVEWGEYTDTKVSGTFSHPQGGKVTIVWDMARAKQADLGAKDNWKKYPRQMLRARVISEGVRTVYPAVLSGFYTPEEVQDFDEPKGKEKDVTPKAEDKPKEPEYIPPPPPESLEGDTVIATIDEIEVKTGEKNGKPWTKYGIHAYGKVFGTFDKKVADQAEFWKGQEAKIVFRQDGKFLTCLSVVDAETESVNV